MTTFISILRGINVSGQKKIQMADLRALFEDLGFQNVTTFIQSGNVIFKTEEALDLSLRIEKEIFKRYRFNVPVILRTSDEMIAILETNPFIQENHIDTDRLYLTFLAESPRQELITKVEVMNFNPERFVVVGREIYLYCPEGYGRTKLNNNFFEKKLDITATTRNWKTVNKLSELANVC